MSDIDVKLIQGQLPPGFCFLNWQQIYDAFFNLGIGKFPNNATVWNFGPTTPPAANRDRPWARINASGSFDRVYVYNGGYWASGNPTPASSSERRIWTGDTPSLDTYDGGSAGVVSDNTGPMWEVDTNFEGRVPIGVGVIPDDTTTLTVGQNYGTGVHLIVQNELPENLSFGTVLAGFRANMESLAPIWLAHTPGGGTSGATTPPNETITQQFTNTGGAKNWKTSQPVRAVYFIKRTARVNYALPG